MHIFGKGCCCTIFDKQCCGNCPQNYTDDGCTCRRDSHTYAKQSYTRGPGTMLKCKENKILEDGLCYKQCPEGYQGSSFMCKPM